MKPTAKCTIYDAKTFYEECTCGSSIDGNLECHEKQLLLDGSIVDLRYEISGTEPGPINITFGSDMPSTISY